MAYYHPPRPSAPTTPLVTYRPNATYKISLGSPQGQRRINFTHKNKLHESLWESRALPTSCNQNYDSYNNSNRKRKSRDENSIGGGKVVGKNMLRPSHKPVSQKNYEVKKQITSHNAKFPQYPLKLSQPRRAQTPGMGDSLETVQKVNEKLREMKLSESIQPIVHPYRDKSTDSYHYGHGHSWSEANQASQADKLKYPYHSRPCQQHIFSYSQHPKDEINFETTCKLEMNCGGTSPCQNNLDSAPLFSFNALRQTCTIKQELQEQKQSKELRRPLQLDQERIFASAGKQNHHHDGRLFEFPMNETNVHKESVSRNEQTEAVNESEAQKCEKIRYLYEPYSMNLSSNRKNQNAFLYQSDHQTPKSKETRPERIKLHRPPQEPPQRQLDILEGEDKWDKILRIRQQQYLKTVSRQQSEAEDSFYNLAKGQDYTAAKTDAKYLPGGNLQQFKPYTVDSYQSSNAKENLGLHYEGEAERGKLDFNSEGQKGEESKNEGIEESESTNKFYDKLQAIVNSYKNTPGGNLNQMKYSYSFEQTKQAQFRTEKTLFSKLLSSTQLEWMLIYSQMITYAEQTYDIGNRGQRGQGKKALVDFVKIGERGDNHIMGHYIGVWLLWMGYDDRNVKERVLENVELMFMDVDDIIAQDNEMEPGQSQPAIENIRNIAEIMYNNLFYGYLPESLQMQAVIETCRRGWEYLTFLISRLIKLLLKISKRKMKKIQSGLQGDVAMVSDDFLYQQLEKALEITG